MPVAFGLAGILSSYSPSLASLAIAAICSGQPGIRGWLARWMRWRVGWTWYALAFLSAPVLFVVQHLITHPTEFSDHLFAHPTWRELRDSYIGFFLSIILYLPYIAGEEGGWRGFALPRLQERYGPIWASCIIAAMWEVWHFPGTLPSATPYYESGAVAIGVSLVRIFLIFILFSMICTWIFNRTRGSILPVIPLACGDRCDGRYGKTFFSSHRTIKAGSCDRRLDSLADSRLNPRLVHARPARLLQALLAR
jgi:uncharacterized protein